MTLQSDALRAHLVRLLDWEEAHAGFDKAVAGLPPDKRGEIAAGFEHSPWQLLEHLRIAQADILDFCVNRDYVHERAWPDDYWPKSPEPPEAGAWDVSVGAYRVDRDALKRLAQTQPDLLALVPTGTGNQTYLRAIFLVADHAAYHIGQLVAVRRALGAWS
jgi:uncharacterized damage-inducible protein DinB